MFSLAVASGVVATMRGYRLAPLVWGVGLALASTVGYLRIAADRHYLTDVLAGATIGSAVGFAIPVIFHHPDWNYRAPRISASPLPGGGAIGLAWVY